MGYSWIYILGQGLSQDGNPTCPEASATGVLLNDTKGQVSDRNKEDMVIQPQGCYGCDVDDHYVVD